MADVVVIIFVLYCCIRQVQPIKKAQTDDIIIDVNGVDEANTERKVVWHTSQYQDRRIAFIALLGQNYATGNKWNLVSRTLCDVSLTTVGKQEVAMVDVAASPGGIKR